MIARNATLTRTILWVLAAAYAVALVANISFGLSIPIAIVLLLSVAFALVHGAVRYGWSGIAAFIVICLVVSNILENISILTGFPFGHYHYTDSLGPKLIQAQAVAPDTSTEAATARPAAPFRSPGALLE